MEDEIIGSTAEDVAQPEISEAPVEKSMDDTIRETLESIQSRGEEATEQAEDRARDEQGRFAKKNAAPESTQNSAEESTSAPAPEPAAAPSVPLELQRLGLRKDEAEAIASNPIALQAFMRRSEEMHKGLEGYRERAHFGERMIEAMRPFADTLRQLNVQPDVAIQKLFSADHALRNGNAQQKAAMIQQICRDYGVDLQQAQEAPAYNPDPQVVQLQTQLQQMQSWIQQQNQSREWQERESLNSEIQKFQSDPAHVHFEAVRNDMAALLQSGIASDLKDAYERAIYTNPTVRAQVLAQQQAEQENKRKAEAAQKAQDAKRAAQVNLSRRGRLPAAQPVGTMEDTIRQAAERLGIM